jgi:hypothetical protein
MDKAKTKRESNKAKHLEKSSLEGNGLLSIPPIKAESNIENIKI